tara:strand:+ start:521 stop:880 length:360 start_codon:yes stop_codon:yes gene_type:complete
LRPKSHKSFFEEVSKEIGVHKDVVEDLVAFYYAKVRKNLSTLSYHKINVSNLGTFSLRKNKLIKAIKRQKDILGNLEKMTFDGYDKSVPVKEKIEEMERGLDLLNKSIIKKKNFKNEIQ